jgi:hypothetical protein
VWQGYVAPPGFHMIVEEGFLRVLQGPRENLRRPAIDPLFRSAAAAYGRRVTLSPPSTSAWNKGKAVETALWEALRALKRKRLALSANGRPREGFTS